MPQGSKIKILVLALAALIFLGYGAQYLAKISERSNDGSTKPADDAIAHSQAGQLAERIQELELAGFVGLKVNPDNRSADVWLSEERSPELLAAIGEEEGFKVNLRNAPYSLAQLEGAIEKINELVRRSDVPGGVVLSSSAKREDGAGIDLTIHKTSKVPDEKWVESVSDYLRMPVFVDSAKTNITLGSTRIQDDAPWRGASLFATTVDSGKTAYCSRGFGVISKSTRI